MIGTVLFCLLQDWLTHTCTYKVDSIALPMQSAGHFLPSFVAGVEVKDISLILMTKGHFFHLPQALLGSRGGTH